MIVSGSEGKDMKSNVQTVVRLNAETFPMIDGERQKLSDAGISVVEVETLDENALTEQVVNADGIMVVSAYLRKAVVSQLKRCRIISRLGTGVDKIDIGQATAQGIYVTNIPDFCTEEVADHTMALLLAAARRLKYYESNMRQGQQPHDIANMHRLSNQTLGIVGFGQIGKAVARRAQAFGMRVIVCDPMLKNDQASQHSVTIADMDTILKESDYISLLCPLTSATRGMLGMCELKRMKPTAVLVNTGRGELVKEDELVTALREGVIRYAALDVYGVINVFQSAGFATDHPLFDLDNVLLTPHVSAYSQEALEDVQIRGAQAVVDVLSGKSPQYPVNPDVVPVSII